MLLATTEKMFLLIFGEEWEMRGSSRSDQAWVGSIVVNVAVCDRDTLNL